MAHNMIYEFGNRVYKHHPSHPLLPIIVPLTQAWGDGVFRAQLGIISTSKFNRFTGIAGITPAAVSSLAKDVDPSDLWKFTYFPHIDERVNRWDTPLFNGYRLMWDLLHRSISAFVRVYYTSNNDVIDDTAVMSWLTNTDLFGSYPKPMPVLDKLINTITMMHFNNITHELISHEQNTYFDYEFLRKGGDIYSHRPFNDGRPPPLLASLLSLYTTLTTRYESRTYADRSFTYLVEDQNPNAKRVLDDM